MSRAQAGFSGWALWEVARPGNAALAALAVGIGGWLVSPGWPAGSVWCAMAAAALICAGAGAQNDYIDYERDRTAHPRRPLSAGRLHPEYAIWGWLVAGVAALGLSLAAGAAGLGITLLAATLVGAYNVFGRGVPILGPVLLCTAAALTFLLGAQAAGNGAAGLFPALFAWLLCLARVWVRDLRHPAGDPAVGRRSLTAVIGTWGARVAVTAALGALLLVTEVPVLLDQYATGYMIIVYAGLDLCVIWVLFRLWRTAAPPLGEIDTVLKAAMGLGLGALLVA